MDKTALQALGHAVAINFSKQGVLDRRCLDLAMNKAKEAMDKGYVTAITAENLSNWVRANYPHWFGAAPGTVAVPPAPAAKPAPRAPSGSPARNNPGKPSGKAASDATVRADSSAKAVVSTPAQRNA